MFGENIKTVRRNTKAVLAASTEAGLEITVENTKYITVLLNGKNAGQNRSIKMSVNPVSLSQNSDIWGQP